jgi:hypothetical protein
MTAFAGNATVTPPPYIAANPLAFAHRRLLQ